MSVEQKPQQNPFNGAALQPGNPGNSGGKKGRSGRPPGVVREACAKAFAARIKFLKDVVDGKTGEAVMLNGQPLLIDGKPFIAGADVADRLKAMDLLGKYGGLQKIETEHVHKHYREQIEKVREGLRLVG